MNIEELDSYNLGDAVKFHDKLNPRLWGTDEHLLPEVRAKLLEIAADFQEFLGIRGLDVDDITISGSNAAYNYTNNSDIDLHLVVDLPESDSSEVYRELFDAKKFQYNQQHDIKIGGYDVELYVQDPRKEHHSQGIYSVKNNDWISVPRRRKAEIDDMSVKSKYEDLADRIKNTIATHDHEQITQLFNKIKHMRQSGLDQQGEFGVDNLAFKMLRAQGHIQKLIDARNAARDAELSLTERKKKKKKTKVRYGYGGYWSPGFDFGSQDSGGGDGGGGGESVREASTPDGVSPSTKMFLEQQVPDVDSILSDFVGYCTAKLDIDQAPKLQLRRDPAWSQRNHSFGQFEPGTNTLNISVANRHVMDILRTVAHELVHYRQQQQHDLPADAGETGSDHENQANAVAGQLMRNYAQMHPEYFEPGKIAEANIATSAKATSAQVRNAHNNNVKFSNKQNTVETVDVEAIQNDMLREHLLSNPALYENREDFQSIREFLNLHITPQPLVNRQYVYARVLTTPISQFVTVAHFAKAHKLTKLDDQFAYFEINGTTKKFPDSGNLTGDLLSQVYFFKSTAELTQFITLLKLKFSHYKHTAKILDEKRIEESSGYIPTNAEKSDPRFLMALTKDVRPGATGKNANKMALKTDAQGRPALLMKTANLRENRLPQPSQGPGKYRDLNEPLGPETPPTMPAGTVRVDVSDMYDWYKLGQHISNMKGLGKHDFGAGPPSSIVSFGDEDLEHDYIQALKRTGLETTDIDPVDPNQPPGMPRQKTDPTFNVGENFADGKNPQDKGDSSRHGIPKKASISSLRKIAKQGGRKGQLAHWQANMRSGRAKAKANEAISESEQLLEINMSPSNLRMLAAQTGAMAGMEFEMIVPDTRGGTGGESEPDYDSDETVTSIEDAIQFFDDGDHNTSRELRRLRERMSDEYQEWLGNAWMENFEAYKNTIVFRYGKENWSESDIAEIMDLDEAETEALENRGATPEDYMDAAEKVIADGLDPWLSDAQEDAQIDYYNDEHEEDWLESEGIATMSDIESKYQIMWPHWTSGDSGDQNIEEVADEFSQAIGRKVNWSDSYHGGKRTADAYVVEPDSSLEPDDSDDAGLEFVSPPLPIDDMISDLNKVKAWAKQNGCYTNDSTGLHINVSVPKYAAENLDYVKLALLLGDQYVLDLFGRDGNTYAKSAMTKIKAAVKQNPAKAAEVLNLMKDGLSNIASRAIFSGITDKYTSINNKTGYIEFRSPGGDWLDENFDKIENTLLRFTVALDAALDPAKYREEYLKKLYQLLAPVSEKDPIAYFAQYAAGELPAQALKSFVRQVQLERETARTQPAVPAASDNYKIYRISDGGVIDTFRAVDAADAEEKFRDWTMSPSATQVGGYRYAPIDTVIRGPADQPGPGGTWTGQWAIKDNRGNTLYTFGGVGNSQADANRTAAAWLARAGYQAGLEVEVVPVMGP